MNEKFMRLMYTYVISPIKTRIMPIYYKIFKTKKIGINLNNDRKTKIVVSLTSIPTRLDKAYLTIETILRQTMKPDKVILYLGENAKNVKLPNQLIEQQKRGLTIEYRDDSKLKPHTKYFYAMQEYIDDIIITVDDDIYYNKRIIENLYNSYIKYSKAISCMRCHKIKINKNRIEPYNLWEWEYNKEDALFPNNALLATGVGGVLYPPHILSKETFNIDKLNKLCPNADDIWLKCMEVENNVKVVKACKKNYYLYTIRGSQEVALSKGNVDNCENDMQIKNAFDYYNTCEKINE